jgi:hypothetical protein
MIIPAGRRQTRHTTRTVISTVMIILKRFVWGIMAWSLINTPHPGFWMVKKTIDQIVPVIIDNK